MKNEINIDDFAKIDIKIGTIVATELVPDTDKLIKCTVDFGLKPSALADGSPDHSPEANGLGEDSRDIRTIVSGIAELRNYEELVGKQLPYITNLAPRTIKGVESNGMLLAVGDGENFALLHPDVQVPPGTSGK